jgi:hypothetical protein
MKNWLLNTLRTAVILLSATLLITSCQQSDFDEPLLDGETVMVSFNSSIDNQALTRAWDGKNVDKLYFELYVDQSRIERKEFDVTDGNIVNFKIELLKNMTYTAVFWAQKSSCEAYIKDNDNLSEISIDYSKISSDFSAISNCDAFHAACTFTVNQETIQNGVDVKLTRPFALIVAGVNDIASGAATSITVSNVATKFNAFSYEASEGERKTFNFTPDGTILVPGNSHKMIGMAYVLPLKDTATTVTVKTPSKESSINLEKLEANKKYNILSAQ